ncbi:PREDICTED: lipopolysaccharide-induced tumor necrosis factor-alpha factor homolog [Rhagoletis zephyria]|uniref:lipopolysaccharide-induced tumor necrosis factor-alpha factor homolog n=1 Tax=Rhagoletis zephyria TaxID=28612 RepID=UPI0008115E00|nr:PREDICTED: lipopolysaccharide-induced tumor necrosis factor-alpha factor homolog [Rhagoletis zephyria]XP_036330414.1 lipopolysaccharide-induced tumor necrosis factor-alpha factor homolog isoform X3 [Rhagoletis pomonella]
MSNSQPGFTPAQTYQPPPPHSQTVIIQATSSAGVPVSNEPTRIVCPSCHAQVLTTVKHQATTRTHCWALVLCILFCWPCVCVPYCMKSCQNANHYCPNCNAFIGTYSN